MPYQSAVLEDLLRACTDGDPEAWKEFVARFHRIIAATVVKTGRPWRIVTAAVVDDIIQEVYLKLCRDRYRILRDFDLRHTDSFTGLLKSVAFSVVQDHIRASVAAKRGAGHEQLPLEETIVFATAPQVERDILLQEISDRLETETSRDRTIFWLHYQQGMTSRSISEIPSVGLSSKGVESVLSRLTTQLRQELAAPAAKGKSVRNTFPLGDG